MIKFFRSKKSPDKASNPGESPSDLPNTDPRPRHYTFGHLVIPQISMRDPMTFFAALRMDTRNFLQYLCDVNDDITKKEKDPFFIAPDDIEVRPTSIQPFPCVLLKLPEPKFPVEVHFVAVVLKVAPGMASEAHLQQGEKPPIRIFTLEKALPNQAESETVLGEWHDEAHLNHGPGPAPVADDFLHRVAALMVSE